MSSSSVERLSSLVARTASPQGAEWFEAKRAAVAAAGGGPELGSAFAAAARKLGTTPVALDDADPTLRLAAGQRGLDEVGRIALLLAAAGRCTDLPALAKDLFARGENREKQSVLRALPLLPDPARFLDIGVEACRSSVQTVFEAIACENPYPADHFSEAAFNQMVLKAIFNEVPVERIAGLERRAGQDLVRMVKGYGDERRAAGRTVPKDIERICALVKEDQR